MAVGGGAPHPGAPRTRRCCAFWGGRTPRRAPARLTGFLASYTDLGTGIACLAAEVADGATEKLNKNRGLFSSWIPPDKISLQRGRKKLAQCVRKA